METKRKKWTPKERQYIWRMYMGQIDRGECLCCCSEPITIKNFDIGHIEALNTGGSNDYDNLRPVCGHCNNSMGTTNMVVFQRERYPNAKPIIAPKRKPKKVVVKISEDPIQVDHVSITIPKADNITRVVRHHQQQQTATGLTDQQRIILRNRVMTFIILIAVIAILITVISSKNN